MFFIMKHIRIYSTATEKNKDITRPRVYMTNRTSGSPVYFDATLNLTEIYSGSGTVQPKTSGSFSAAGNAYNYKYQSTTNPQQDTININVDNVRNKSIVGLSINDGDMIIGTINFGGAPQGYNFTFTSDKVYIYDYLKEPSGQGGSTTIVKYIYTKDINLTTGSTVTYKVYTW